MKRNYNSIFSKLAVTNLIKFCVYIENSKSNSMTLSLEIKKISSLFCLRCNTDHRKKYFVA